MRDYARSRREAEDGVDIVHGLTDGAGVHAWLSGSKPPFTDCVFCSATKASGVDFISK